MKRVLLTAFCLIAAVGFAWFVKTQTSASPAETLKGTGCLVKDADGVQYWDEECQYHIVYKYDKDGELQFVYYQDHGTVPETAPKPSTATRFGHVVTCNGCRLEGTYEEIVTPSGKYHSSGPN